MESIGKVNEFLPEQQKTSFARITALSPTRSKQRCVEGASGRSECACLAKSAAFLPRPSRGAYILIYPRADAERAQLCDSRSQKALTYYTFVIY
jgi:hypothetical protein